MTVTAAASRLKSSPDYHLDTQIGFLLRQAHQRHTTIFAALMIEDLTPTQWAAIAKLRELGPCSQNALGRQTAMDAATIKGVIDRLTKRGLTATTPDKTDGRRLTVALSEAGIAVYERAKPIADRISRETLAPIGLDDYAAFIALLRKLI